MRIDLLGKFRDAEAMLYSRVTENVSCVVP